MSEKSSAKKTIVVNEANDVLYDAFQAVQLPENFPAEPPWPEWNDAEINAENWGNGYKIKPQTTSKSTGKSDVALYQPSSFYNDPEPGQLPSDLQKHVAQWKRPHELFPQDSLTINGSSEFSLSLTSECSSNCELFKILSRVWCLLTYHAAAEPFPIEHETPAYVANTKGQPWKPWHHIYGSCKAGKDQAHRPVYYSYGKYIIRLFYFGAWRKFVVDDQIPCDAYGNCMLPVTNKPGELWPILLAKAILKISSPTVTCHVNQMDLPIWTLFTGWFPGPFPALNKTKEQIWRLIHAFTPNFALTDESEHDFRHVSSISSKSAGKKPERKEKVEKGEKPDEGRPVLTVAELGNFSEETNLHGKTYETAVLMTRDIPLVPSKMREPTEPWKRIRWVHWAAKKGLWTDEQLIPPYRCLYQINFEREIYELTCIDPGTESRLFIPDNDDDDNGGFRSNHAGGDAAEGNMADSPLQWIDFYKFIKYLRNLTFFLKPSFLDSKCKMTYINCGPASSCVATKAKSMPPTIPETSFYYMLPTVQISGNEPPILYCESLSSIFITISLWVRPNVPPESRNSFSSDHMRFFYHGSLIVEKYDWRTASQNKIIAAVNTTGYGTCCVFLNPGRHALRLWLDTDSPFVIDVHSNTEITVGKSSKIRFVMSNESLAITEYVNRVSTAFLELTQKFGYPEYGKYLSKFYENIKSRNSIIPWYKERMNFFIEALSLSIFTGLKSIVTNEDELRGMAKALQCLFLSPKIMYSPQKLKSGASVIFQKKTKTVAHTEPREQNLFFLPSQDRDRTSEEIEKVIFIQRVFRGYRVRQILSYHSPNNKQHKIITEKLKKIYEVMFAPNKRDVEVARLIRETIVAKPELLETFLFYSDIPNVVVTEEFTGKITGVESKAWVPMIRFIFACHSQDPLPCSFYHYCNLEQYTVTVTDNDTNEEIFRLVNSTCPHYYTRNQRGYTLFVHGWNGSEPKTVNWKLEMVKMKYFLDVHPCNTTLIAVTGAQCHPYQPQPLSVQEIRNFYVPNKQNKICKCLIKVRKRILVAIRLAISSENARFYARVCLRNRGIYSNSASSIEDSETIVEAEVKSSAIIFPSVLLDHEGTDDQNDQTVYVLEAFVAHNSWPLTKHEWGVVEPIRANGETWTENAPVFNMNQPRKSSTGSRRRSVRTSKVGSIVQKNIESPFWNLQVITDFSPDLSHTLEVIEDRSYQEMIKGMKLTWEENDPGRRERGKLIQKEFLKTIYSEMLDARKFLSTSEIVEYSAEFRDSWNISLSSNAFDEGFEGLLHDIKSFSYLTNDKTQVKYLKSPRILPPTPLAELITKYSRIKDAADAATSTEDSFHLRGEDYIAPNETNKNQDVLQEERKKLMARFKKRWQILEEHYTRENNLSKQLMDEAYEDRRKVIERIRAQKEKLENRNN